MCFLVGRRVVTYDHKAACTYHICMSSSSQLTKFEDLEMRRDETRQPDMYSWSIFDVHIGFYLHLACTCSSCCLGLVAAASGIIASEIAATLYEKGMNCLPRLPFRYLRLRDRRSNPNDYALQPAGRSIQEVQMTVRTASTWDSAQCIFHVVVVASDMLMHVKNSMRATLCQGLTFAPTCLEPWTGPAVQFPHYRLNLKLDFSQVQNSHGNLHSSEPEPAIKQ